MDLKLNPVFENEKISPPQNIYTFEILRFVAAFVTFFGHYVHYYMWFNIPDNVGVFHQINPSNIGSLAVPIFFLLSVAIFAHTYGNGVASRKISFFNFFKKRMARLYPLHLLTLILVLILQTIIYAKNNSYFIYPNNDFKHFILQILFISNWTLFEDGSSFNGPVWSVSHEVLLYMVFFLFFYLSSFSKHKNKFILGCYLVTFFLDQGRFIYNSQGPILYSYVFKSLFTFMTGVFIYQCYRYILRFGKIKLLFLSIGYLLLLILLSGTLEGRGIPYGAAGPITIFLLLMYNTFFPLKKENALNKVFFELGNLTYSSYLLHFPVMMALLVFSESVYQLDFTLTPVLGLYIVCVLITSYFVNKYYEVPAKKWILTTTFLSRTRGAQLSKARG